ncbi:hypothetical protein MF672_019495 [Actinomadura sp. ATCC 31491]|uniref:Uncharacterized protein n=1 Tax=Actinomadura luzonensis TaxID=2805427 RepID=A0ABT0FUF1_9ACTN|nr:hypothetical protein [Actinomadura luzonensis]MCK2215963.1 hypothetical protein [Actinomadura luzonensis]
MGTQRMIGRIVLWTLLGAAIVSFWTGFGMLFADDDRLRGAALIAGSWLLVAGGVVLGDKLGVPLIAIKLERTGTSERLRQAAEDPGRRLQRRIERVNSAFAEAAALMDELRRDLAAQQIARQALLEEAERQQQILDIDEEEAEKIRQILMRETRTAIQAERRQQWFFFALGALASIPIGVAVNLLVP